MTTVLLPKIPKTKPRIIIKRDTKHFTEQGFMYDLFYFDWDKMNLIADVENA